MKLLTAVSVLSTLTAQHFAADAASIIRSRQSASACGKINEQVAQYRQSNSSSRLLLDGQEAYDCLQSIPFNSTAGVAFAQELTKHVQWQADIDTLRDPPTDQFGKADLLGGLATIEEKAQSNDYTSQVDFDADISNLINSANDGHLGVQLCSNSIFSFDMNTALVSVANSSDSEPGVYIYDDVAALNGSLEGISPIVTINGQDVAEFLNDYDSLITLRDADARYNSLFASSARHGISSTLRGLFATRNNLWTGYGSLSYTCANGTEGNFTMIAYGINTRRWNYTTGQELYDVYCAIPTATGSSSNGTGSVNSTATSSPSIAPTQTAGYNGYPEPIARDPYNIVNGYYLDDGDNDTAVLFIPTFETSGPDDYTTLPLPDNETTVFAEETAKFLSQAKSDNKSRLIIDLTANGGGTTISGFNLFKLLFPNIPIWESNRYRNHDFSRLLMKALTNYSQDYNDTDTFYVPRHFGWEAQVAPNQGPLNWTSYTNFTDGPSSNLTALTGFMNFTANQRPNGYVQGYGNVSTVFSDPPFDPSNILILTDGYCASTCSIFVYLMTQEAGVKNSIVMGGRPSSSSSSSVPPMQLVGGTRGTEAYNFETIASVASFTLDYIHERINASEPTLSSTEIDQFKSLMPIPPSDFPLQFGGGSVNLRNGYMRSGDQTDVPLEFLSQEATCRLYYTAQNILEPGTVWRDAFNAVWGNGTCLGKSSGKLGASSSEGATGGNGTASQEQQKSTNAAAGSVGPNMGSSVLALLLAGWMALLML